MMTSSTSFGSTPARFTASRTAIAPRRVAGTVESAPRNLPTGVRQALAAFTPMAAGRGVVQLSSYLDQLLATFLAAGAVSKPVRSTFTAAFSPLS